MAYITFQNIFTNQSVNIIESIQEFFTLRVHLERLGDITLSKPEDTQRKKHIEIKGKIEFKDVFFRYGTDQSWILKNVSFVILPGEHVAITGKSGIGKSTLLNLIKGEVKPQHGTILIDDVNLEVISIASRRSSIILVSQGDTSFLEGSIEDNITYFDNEPNEKLLVDACKKARIYEKINKLPQKFRSKIGVSNFLSGGELQRLILARAFYRKGSILLLDEATSNLDKEVEKEIYDKIHEIKKTIISVAHSEETTKKADKIYEISNERLNIFKK